MAAGAGRGAEAGLLWIDGAGVWVESGRDDDAGAEGWRRIRPHWREDVDHVGHDCGCGDHLGQGRRTRKTRSAGFLVETDRPGFRADEVHGKWSLRASVTAGLRLQEVKIPATNLLAGNGRAEESADVPEPGALRHQLGRDWGGNVAAMTRRSQYAKMRKQFRNEPIASHQMIQERLVWMISEISKAQLLCLHAGRMKDAGTLTHEIISLAKRNNVWMALELRGQRGRFWAEMESPRTIRSCGT